MTTQVTPAASHPPDPAAPFSWERTPWGWVLTCAPLVRLGRHGFTARDLDPGRGVTPDAAWTAVADWLGVPPSSLWRLDQVHGCRALRVDASALPAGDPLPPADAAITTRTDVAVAVKAADCVPILMAHPAGAVAAVHAGWRGTSISIIKLAIAQLEREYGSHATDMRAAIGPAANVCCYEVGSDVINVFKERFPAAGHLFQPTREGHARIDLQTANRHQLIDAGLAAERIHVAPFCTMDRNDLFFSYRREKHVYGRVGRLMSVIGIAGAN